MYFCILNQMITTMSKGKAQTTISIKNRRAEFEYFLLTKLTAGIVLTGTEIKSIRAGKANMLLSPLFTKVLVDVTGVPLELRQADGSMGAALGAGIGLGYYTDPAEALGNVKALATIEPERDHPYEALYQKWKTRLEKALVEL